MERSPLPSGCSSVGKTTDSAEMLAVGKVTASLSGRVLPKSNISLQENNEKIMFCYR
jgi:hypothetical protein